MKSIYALVLTTALVGCAAPKPYLPLSDDQIMNVYEKVVKANNLPEIEQLIIESKDYTFELLRQCALTLSAKNHSITYQFVRIGK